MGTGFGISVPLLERESRSISDAQTPPRENERQDVGSWPRRTLDSALVMLDWILIGPLLLQAQSALPGMLHFGGLLHPSTLIGVAFLHGVLINLLSSPCRSQSSQEETRTLGKTVFWATLVLSAALQLQGYSVLGFAAWGAGFLHFGMLWGGRRVGWKGNIHDLHAVRGMRNVLIVGAGPLGRRIAEYLGHHPELKRSVCGFIDDRKPLGDGVLGRTGNLAEVARGAFVDEVILASPYDQDTAQRVVRRARQLRLDVKVAPYLFGCEPDGKCERIGNIPLISLHEETLPVRALLLKRALDIVGAGCMLLVTAPVLMLIAILIKVDSAGPVFYKALRAGRKRRPFYCYKFRTMVSDADNRKDGLRAHNQRTGPIFKIKNDPRITRVGGFLRRYSLDELPQLWNVLKGEMSMVGPRPHPIDDVSSYAIEHLRRLDVVPGMTGLWQVKARQNPSFQIALDLDVEYIRSWCIGMDLRILLKTAGAVLRGSGE